MITYIFLISTMIDIKSLFFFKDIRSSLWGIVLRYFQKIKA